MTRTNRWTRTADVLVDDAAEDARSDLREFFEHRAAVAEFDGGLDRAAAERLAALELIEVIQEDRR